jgi:glycosyltransferase involved in cell wall biosynthesis
VVVLASFAEGLPAGLYEPMAKAIPCVSTRIAGHPEIIEDSVNGYLVSASDPRALADRLERLLGDAELRVELGRRSREKVEAEYDLERNYPRLAALFAEVAASGSRKLGS